MATNDNKSILGALGAVANIASYNKLSEINTELSKANHELKMIQQSLEFQESMTYEQSTIKTIIVTMNDYVNNDLNKITIPALKLFVLKAFMNLLEKKNIGVHRLEQINDKEYLIKVVSSIKRQAELLLPYESACANLTEKLENINKLSKKLNTTKVVLAELRDYETAYPEKPYIYSKNLSLIYTFCYKDFLAHFISVDRNTNFVHLRNVNGAYNALHIIFFILQIVLLYKFYPSEPDVLFPYVFMSLLFIIIPNAIIHHVKKGKIFKIFKESLIEHGQRELSKLLSDEGNISLDPETKIQIQEKRIGDLLGDLNKKYPGLSGALERIQKISNI